MNLLTCYKILGLSSSADAAQAKRAYKAQVRRWHPDRFPANSPSKTGAEEQLKQINVAYARVKEHLAAQQSAADIGRPNTASPGSQTATDGPSNKAPPGQRSWLDALIRTFHQFAGRGQGAASASSADTPTTPRKKSFGQVLDEIAGTGRVPPKKHKQVRSAARQQRSAGYRHRRSSGSSVDAVSGTERPGPVRPVGRVRGIGKSR